MVPCHVCHVCSCRVTEDVCAYPTGDFEAQRAVRSTNASVFRHLFPFLSQYHILAQSWGQHNFRCTAFSWLISFPLFCHQTRAVSVWLGQGLDNECLQKFRTFICSMYFPKCRYRITVPVICTLHLPDYPLEILREEHGGVPWLAPLLAQSKQL